MGAISWIFSASKQLLGGRKNYIRKEHLVLFNLKVSASGTSFSYNMY